MTTQTEALKLAREGVEIHSPHMPEYKVCAALIALADQLEQRKPLDDEQITEHFQEHIDTGSLLSFVAGVRYAEAAHGITSGEATKKGNT